MSEYKVQFEVFEGPLDLLLYLVKKQEVDIYRVNLTELAVQFIAYVDLMRQLDLDIAGEFLVMATTLMYIKSRELLPVDQQAQVEGDAEEGEDPRWELIRKLVEYKKYKDAASELRMLEHRREQIFPRRPGPLELDCPAPATEATIFDLVSAVSAVLQRVQERRKGDDIFQDRWTVSEKIDFLRELLGRRGSARFSELFEDSASRTEVVVTFLALLELIRLRQLAATQAEPFGDIQIVQIEGAVAVGHDANSAASELAADGASAPAEASEQPAR